MRIFWLTTCLTFWLGHPLGLTGQVTDDFEGGSTAQWFSEGDGDFSVSNAQGNPGSSFLVDDDATGSINYAIAPARYLGDWSAALATDSLVMDIYVESSDPDTIPGALPAFELVGPGGRATVLEGLDLSRNTWNRVGVRLDSVEWNVSQGTWTDLLANVTLLRVRAEYITGNENVYLDNVRLDVVPPRIAITDTICSTFEDGTVDGWRFEDAAAIGVDSASGNPGLGLSVGDRSSVLSQAIAPPKFWGDWTALTDSGKLAFDLWIDQSSGSLYDKEYLVQLTGNGAVAIVRPPDSILDNAVGQWYPFSFFIDSSEWTMQSGTWDSLLTNVEEIRLQLEFITGGEVARLDNFCLLAGPERSTHAPDSAIAGAWQAAPNPARETVTLRWQGETHATSAALQVTNMQGQTLHRQRLMGTSPHRLSVADWPAGLYLLHVRQGGQTYTQRLLVR